MYQLRINERTSQKGGKTVATAYQASPMFEYILEAVYAITGSRHAIISSTTFGSPLTSDHLPIDYINPTGPPDGIGCDLAGEPHVYACSVCERLKGVPTGAATDDMYWHVVNHSGADEVINRNLPREVAEVQHPRPTHIALC